MLLCCGKEGEGRERATAAASRLNAERKKKTIRKWVWQRGTKQSNDSFCKRTCAPSHVCARDGERRPPRRLDIVSAVFHRCRNKYTHPPIAVPLFSGPLSSSVALWWTTPRILRAARFSRSTKSAIHLPRRLQAPRLRCPASIGLHRNTKKKNLQRGN